MLYVELYTHIQSQQTQSGNPAENGDNPQLICIYIYTYSPTTTHKCTFHCAEKWLKRDAVARTNVFTSNNHTTYYIAAPFVYKCVREPLMVGRGVSRGILYRILSRRLLQTCRAVYAKPRAFLIHI